MIRQKLSIALNLACERELLNQFGHSVLIVFAYLISLCVLTLYFLLHNALFLHSEFFNLVRAGLGILLFQHEVRQVTLLDLVSADFHGKYSPVIVSK